MTVWDTPALRAIETFGQLGEIVGPPTISPTHRVPAGARAAHVHLRGSVTGTGAHLRGGEPIELLHQTEAQHGTFQMWGWMQFGSRVHLVRVDVPVD